MALGKSVQFNTVDAVCDAYQMRCVPAFSVFQGTQLLFKYEGADMDEGEVQLREFCQLLASSAAIYTLCVYEDLKGKISNKTPYQGSYNFRLQERTEFQQVSGLSAIQDQLKRMNERFDELERKRISEELEDMAEEDEPAADPLTDSLDKIAGILEHPVVKSLLPFLTNLLPKQSLNTMSENYLPEGAHEPAAMMAGTTASAPVVIGDMEFPIELLTAVHTICSRFPEAGSALITLADIAQRKPDKMRFILNSMKWL